MAKQDKPNESDDPDANAALEREIRQGRKFSVKDVIGRSAGPGIMKGGSPVSPIQQATFEIEFYLREHVSDPSGVLPIVLLRRVKDSALLLENPGQPLKVLSVFLTRLLETPDQIKELVRETDVEWGQRLGERPVLEKEGQPSHPDDPYTVESVRAALRHLVDKLARA
jgi:hypothetical protein